MYLHELFESTLKLRPDILPNERGQYTAFIITMDPLDFLRLTCGKGDFERIAARPFPYSKEKYDEIGLSDPHYGRFEMPFLRVQWPSGLVTGHEGRHRAMMVHRAGGKNFPVGIELVWEPSFDVTYTLVTYHYNDNDDDGNFTVTKEQKVEEFGSDHDAAWARKKWLEDHQYDSDDQHYRDIKYNVRGGGKIKGSPTSYDDNNPWHHKPYRIDEMPKQLIGQFDHSQIVTKYRVGLVKGYSHFK